MTLSKNQPCHFYRLEKIFLQTKFELSKWTLALSGLVLALYHIAALAQIAPSKNKPRHAFRNAKIYFFAKFRQNIPTFRTNYFPKTCERGGPLAPHLIRTALKKGTSSLRSEVKKDDGLLTDQDSRPLIYMQ